MKSEQLRLSGIALRLGQRHVHPNGIAEIVAPDALRDGLRGDVRLLLGEYPLGRTVAGTLRLSVLQGALRFAADLPDIPRAHDLARLVSRGDVIGADVALEVQADTWARDGDISVRTVTKATLRAIVIATFHRTGTQLVVEKVDATRTSDTWRDDLRRRRLALANDCNRR